MVATRQGRMPASGAPRSGAGAVGPRLMRAFGSQRADREEVVFYGLAHIPVSFQRFPMKVVRRHSPGANRE
jgi:hypothetical protein